MTGIVNRDVQALPITTPASQAAGVVTNSGTNIDGADQVPFVLLLDENVPSRKVSPAGDDTLNAVLTQAQSIVTVLGGTLTVSDSATHTALGGTLTVSDTATHTALGGTLTVSDSATHTALAGTLTVSDTATHTALAGTLNVLPVSAATAALTSKPAATSSGVLLAANGTRRGAIITNDSASATLYLAYAAVASATLYTVKMPPGAVWEMPSPAYTGDLSAIWDAAVGTAYVTELRP